MVQRSSSSSGVQHRQLSHAASDADTEAASVSSRYTVDDALNRCKTFDAFHWLMLVYCGLSWMCDAMEVMILSYLGPSTQCEWNLTAAEESGLSSVVFAGMCVGAPVWGMVSDTWGRKVSFGLATLISAVFGFATAAAPNFQALMAFRALVGFGIPAATVAFNMVLEFTPTRQRGLFAVAIEGFWTIGTVAQAGLAYALLNSKGWRILVLVSTTPYILLLGLLPFVPESPRFLLVKGRVDAAEQVLGKVMKVCRRQLPDGTLQPLLHDSYADPKPVMEAEKGCAGTTSKVYRGFTAVWRALKQLFSAKLWSVTLVLIVIWVGTTLVYYGLVMLVPQLEFVAGESKKCTDGRLQIPRGDLIGNLITSAAEVPGLVFSLFMIHLVSRKLAFAVPMGLIPAALIPLMAGVHSSGGIMACMFLARFCIYSAFNALWALCPEFYPTTVRNFGLGLNNAFSRIGGLIAPFVVATQKQGWQYTPQAVFAALSLLAAAIVFLLPQDKKGRSLDDTVDDVKEVPPIQRGVSSVISKLGSSRGADAGSWGNGSAYHASSGKAGDSLPTTTDLGLSKDVSTPSDSLLTHRVQQQL